MPVTRDAGAGVDRPASGEDVILLEWTAVGDNLLAAGRRRPHQHRASGRRTVARRSPYRRDRGSSYSPPLPGVGPLPCNADPSVPGYELRPITSERLWRRTCRACGTRASRRVATDRGEVDGRVVGGIRWSQPGFVTSLCAS